MKNPNEIKSVFRAMPHTDEHGKTSFRTKVLVINEALTPVKKKSGKDGEPEEWAPMELHHSSFSRFIFTIIKEDKQALNANLNVADYPGVRERTSFAMYRHLDNMYAMESGENLSPGYTVKFTTGELKGKTPVEVLREQGEKGADVLNAQYVWLKKNLDRYPRNQEQLDAIMDSVRLMKEGRLGTRKTVVSPAVSLYHSGFRPLVRKRDENGICPVSELDITWHVGDENPVEVTIDNYRAPVQEDSIGRTIVQASRKTDAKKASMRLTMDEWCSIIDSLESRLRIFEMVEGPYLYRSARHMMWHHEKK